MNSETQPENSSVGYSSRITDVVVMEDRALVTRVATISLSPGFHQLKVGPVTALINDDSIRVKATLGEVKINECKVVRSYLLKGERGDQEKKFQTKIHELTKAYYNDFSELSALGRKRNLLFDTTNRLSHYIGEMTATKNFEPSWKEESDTLWREIERVEKSYLDVQWKQEERLWDLERYEDQLDEMQQPDSEFVSHFLTEIEVENDSEVTLEWNYQVPCAIWRPMYSAELSDDQGQHQVSWKSYGCVWQKTGEDWDGANLSFSTARPALGANMPLLEDDQLSSYEKSKEEQKTIQVESRDEEISIHSTESQEIESDTPPGIDDGGETRTFRILDPVTVKSDGKPYQFSFEAWIGPAETKMTCYPEKEAFVFLKSQQVNPSNAPLLAGPVALIKNGTYVGRSSIKYIAPEERFDLSWGSEDGISVVREAYHNHDEVGLTKQHEYSFDRNIWLTNQTNNAHKIQIKERLPVSEIKQVEVEIDKKRTTEDFQVDEFGVVTWSIDLNEAQEKEISFSFKVNMPQKVKWNP